MPNVAHTNGTVETERVAPAPAVTPTRPLPSDISPRWLDLIRKVRAECAANNGNAIVHINILINERDEPVLWSTPTVTLLEPRRSNEVIATLLQELCQTD